MSDQPRYQENRSYIVEILADIRAPNRQAAEHVGVMCAQSIAHTSSAYVYVPNAWVSDVRHEDDTPSSELAP